MKKVKTRLGKDLILYEHEDCKKQAASWKRYSEDFMRRFVDPLNIDILEKVLIALMYITGILLIASLFYHKN